MQQADTPLRLTAAVSREHLQRRLNIQIHLTGSYPFFKEQPHYEMNRHVCLLIDMFVCRVVGQSVIIS